MPVQVDSCGAIKKTRDRRTAGVNRARGGREGEEQISARKDPLFTGPIEHHDKRTLTVGGACESVQNQFRSFPFRHRRRVYVFTFTSLSQGVKGGSQ